MAAALRAAALPLLIATSRGELNTGTPRGVRIPVHGQQARTPPDLSTCDQNRAYVDDATPPPDLR